MQQAGLPANEIERLRALDDLRIWGTGLDPRFDELSKLVAMICETQIAVISFVDSKQQWFKSRHGMPTAVLPRELALCSHVISTGASLEVPDATLDSRFSDHLFVIGEPYLKFYCGIPLTDESGYTLGTLCVMDSAPRKLTVNQKSSLEIVSRQVMALLDLRKRQFERDRNIERLSKAEEIILSFYNTAPMMMGVVEVQGNEVAYISANPACAVAHKQENPNLVNKTTEDLQVERKITDLWMAKYVVAKKTRKPVQFIYDNSTSSRSQWIQATVNYLPEMSFEAPRYSFVAEDITEKVEKERLLNEQGEALVQSSKMAALGEMAGGIAHEINNPLAIIQGLAERIKKKSGLNADEVINSAFKIEATVDRISKIIKGLSFFAHRSEGEPAEIVGLKSITETTFHFCSESFRNRGVEATFEIENELSVSFRPTQLSQVILNLLNNSCDAIEHLDKKWIKVKAVRASRFVELRISDSGSGISPIILKRIFEPFYTTKQLGKGTGLGLSVAHGIVSAHGGNLFVDAAAPNTTFVIRMPLANADTTAA